MLLQLLIKRKKGICNHLAYDDLSKVLILRQASLHLSSACAKLNVPCATFRPQYRDQRTDSVPVSIVNNFPTVSSRQVASILKPSVATSFGSLVPSSSSTARREFLAPVIKTAFCPRRQPDIRRSHRNDINLPFLFHRRESPSAT